MLGQLALEVDRALQSYWNEPNRMGLEALDNHDNVLFTRTLYS